MKVIENKCFPYNKKIFLYKEDLEKFSTLELLSILKSLRLVVSTPYWQNVDYYDNGVHHYDNPDKLYFLDGKMVCYKCNHNTHVSYYTVMWILKDVLSRRPHIIKSKTEKKAIRQLSAKLHKRVYESKK